MELSIILNRFADFSALSGEDLTACLPLCRDAAQELSGRVLDTAAGNATAAEQLCSAAAALAYYRYALSLESGGSAPRVGYAALSGKGTLEAARRLREEYLAAAAPYLRSPDFIFRQVSSV